MPTFKPTMNLRWGKATDDEINRESVPFCAKNAEEFYILEQLYESISLDGKEVMREWRSISVADERENG